MQNTFDDDDGGVAGRRQFLHCMAWAGAGTLWLMKGGVLHAQPLGEETGVDRPLRRHRHRMCFA